MIFPYKCWDCNLSVDIYRASSVGPPRTIVCPKCNKLCEQDYTRKRIRIDVFKPYVEANLGTSPVEITSKRQREELCAAANATYDSGRYVRKQGRIPWERDLTWDKVSSIEAETLAKVKAMSSEQLGKSLANEDLDRRTETDISDFRPGSTTAS